MNQQSDINKEIQGQSNFIVRNAGAIILFIVFAVLGIFSILKIEKKSIIESVFLEYFHKKSTL